MRCPHPILACWFECQLVCTYVAKSSFQLVFLRRQQMKAQVSGSLIPTLETRWHSWLLAPGSGLDLLCGNLSHHLLHPRVHIKEGLEETCMRCKPDTGMWDAVSPSSVLPMPTPTGLVQAELFTCVWPFRLPGICGSFSKTYWISHFLDFPYKFIFLPQLLLLLGGCDV